MSKEYHWWRCDYCKKNKDEVEHIPCEQSPNGKHSYRLIIVEDEYCWDCGKHKSEIQTNHCSKSPNGKHRYYSRTIDGTTANNLGASLGKLAVLYFSTRPKSLAGVITRGIVFGGIGFILCANNNVALGVVAGVAIFGLYFWYFKKKIDE